jgi:hypothetical protein
MLMHAGETRKKTKDLYQIMQFFFKYNANKKKRIFSAKKNL